MTTAAQPARKQFARHVTDVLEPKNWIIALIGWHSDRLAGAGWGLLGALFAAILPTVFIQHGMRRGRWADRHVGARQNRLIVMAFIIASVTLGVGLLAGLGAPRPVLALTVTMLCAITVLMTITVKWKISVHCAVSSGATVMLALTYGPAFLAAYALVGLVAWSRAELKDHTPAQAAAGTLLSTALSAAIFLTLRLPSRPQRRRRWASRAGDPIKICCSVHNYLLPCYYQLTCLSSKTLTGFASLRADPA